MRSNEIGLASFEEATMRGGGVDFDTTIDIGGGAGGGGATLATGGGEPHAIKRRRRSARATSRRVGNTNAMIYFPAFACRSHSAGKPIFKNTGKP
jgi:hypothetical protein